MNPYDLEVSMKILALEKEVPGVPDDAFEPHLRAEAARAWELHQAGVIRELHFRADRPEAVLVLECAGVDQARTALATLPLVRGEWVEIRVEIDLDNDTQAVYYGGDLLFQDTWTGGMSGGGILSIAAVDLFANNASAVYYDDMWLTSALP